MRKIILPQSIPLIIPPTGNQFIAMLKECQVQINTLPAQSFQFVE
jgi:ABC-type amino acid transport system permease subunit